MVRFLKKGTKSFLVGKKEVSNIIVIRVKVKGSRIRKSFIKILDDRWFYCVFFSLRNKIDLLYLFMKKIDELFFKIIKGFRYSSVGEKF